MAQGINERGLAGAGGCEVRRPTGPRSTALRRSIRATGPRILRVFGDAGYDIVVTVGASISDETAAAARRYPEAAFIGVEQAQQTEIPNLAGLVFHEEQSGFLAGALADWRDSDRARGGRVRGEFHRFNAPVLRGVPGRCSLRRSDGAGDRCLSRGPKRIAVPRCRLGSGIGIGNAAMPVRMWSSRPVGRPQMPPCRPRPASGALVIGTETDAYTRLKDVRPLLLTSAVNDVRVRSSGFGGGGAAGQASGRRIPSARSAWHRFMNWKAEFRRRR